MVQFERWDLRQARNRRCNVRKSAVNEDRPTRKSLSVLPLMELSSLQLEAAQVAPSSATAPTIATRSSFMSAGGKCLDNE